MKSVKMTVEEAEEDFMKFHRRVAKILKVSKRKGSRDKQLGEEVMAFHMIMGHIEDDEEVDGNPIILRDVGLFSDGIEWEFVLERPSNRILREIDERCAKKFRNPTYVELLKGYHL